MQRNSLILLLMKCKTHRFNYWIASKAYLCITFILVTTYC
nr:MAG TPA: hypothetical protein [Caudoviricetes sp.]